MTSILRKLLLFLRQHLNDKGKLFGDLKVFRVTENPPSVVPIDILPTSDGPDIAFVSKNKQITIIELTVSLQLARLYHAAHEYKVSKYQSLLSDLEAKSYTSRLVAVKIGALGHYLNRSCKSLNRAFPPIPKASILLQHHSKYLWPGVRRTGAPTTTPMI